jgi:hypothetical protein
VCVRMCHRSLTLPLDSPRLDHEQLDGRGDPLERIETAALLDGWRVVGLALLSRSRRGRDDMHRFGPMVIFDGFVLLDVAQEVLFHVGPRLGVPPLLGLVLNLTDNAVRIVLDVRLCDGFDWARKFGKSKGCMGLSMFVQKVVGDREPHL